MDRRNALAGEQTNDKGGHYPKQKTQKQTKEKWPLVGGETLMGQQRHTHTPRRANNEQFPKVFSGAFKRSSTSASGTISAHTATNTIPMFVWFVFFGSLGFILTADEWPPFCF